MTDRWSEVERELRREPPVDEARSIERVMAAVRQTQRVESGAWYGWLTQRRVFFLSPAQLLAAAAVGVIAVAGTLAVARRAVPAPEPQSVQFIFVGKAAGRVSVAGDFNNWDPAATPMVRAAGNDVWSVVVPLAPGRYLYSFVVDGARWVTDEAAPRAPGGEYGQAVSVAYVERQGGL
jgi:hypothetical protein